MAEDGLGCGDASLGDVRVRLGEHRALLEAHRQTRATVIVIETDSEKHAPGYDSWWDVPVSEVSEMSSVRKARKEFEAAVRKEKFFL